MKNHHSIRNFLAGFLFAILLLGLSVPALAATLTSKNIEVWPGVSIYMDGAKLNAPEAFVYGGTTYLPVRAISESLGIPVQWDGSTRSVYLGKTPGTAQYLMSVSPPYQTPDQQYYREPTTFKMAGTTYTNGFSMQDNSFALFNLNGKYNSLSFTLGHIDDTTMIDGIFYIYLDGKIVREIECGCGDLPKQYTIPLNGALQMKIEKIDRYTKNYQAGEWYGFANVTVD